MFRFIWDLFSAPRVARTVILLAPGTAGTPRQYRVVPVHAVYAALVGGGILCVLIALLVLLTPLGSGFQGFQGGGANAEQNAKQVQALEDSVEMQTMQLQQLRKLIVGDVAGRDSYEDEEDLVEDFPEPSNGEVRLFGTNAPLRPEEDPPLLADEKGGVESIAATYLPALRRPQPPPVDGLFSRGFDASAGHYGVDIATDIGMPVESIDEGVVVFSDWTRVGGNTIAIQHPDGYLFVYKHNQRLLRSVGEWVRSRETVALSGNSGEITSGPHLHFEVWQGGAPQDPSSLLIFSR